MMSFRFSTVAPLLIVIAVMFPFAVTGCSEAEGIRTFDEPKPARPVPPQLPADQKKFRTIAAMIPQNAGEAGPDAYGQWWFFKLSGPVDVVTANEPAFRALVQSAQFTVGENPLIWDNPPGWVTGDKREFLYASLKLGTKESPTEITVTKASGSVLMNVNRWRTQLGLDDVSASALDSVTSVRNVNNRIVVFVDVSGPKAPPPPGAAGPMMKKH